MYKVETKIGFIIVNIESISNYNLRNYEFINARGFSHNLTKVIIQFLKVINQKNQKVDCKIIF